MLTEKQIHSINSSNSRINLWEGAVRSGKTWGSLYRWIRYVAQAPKEDLLVIGRTERSAVRNVVKPLQLLLGADTCRYYPGKAELYLFDRCCYVTGASDERAEGKIRGMTAGGAYGDEVTLWPESFFIMMLSRLSPKNSKFFGSTNPDNPYHYLKKNFIDRKNELDMSVFQFKLDDNKFLSKKFRKSLAQEYRGLWYKRFIDGLWVMAEGAVYDFFDEAEHVLTRPPAPAISRVVGIDYGTTNPTCFIEFGINHSVKPHIWAEREYYYDSIQAGRQKDDAEYVEDFIKWVGKDIHQVACIIMDPSAASFKAALQKRVSLVIRDADNDVLNGIRTQARLLSTGEYAICDQCEHTKMDYGAYLWDKNSLKRGEDKPLKQNDHTKDVERYVLNTLEGPDSLNYERFVRRTAA